MLKSTLAKTGSDGDMRMLSALQTERQIAKRNGANVKWMGVDNALLLMMMQRETNEQPSHGCRQMVLETMGIRCRQQWCCIKIIVEQSCFICSCDLTISCVHICNIVDSNNTRKSLYFGKGYSKCIKIYAVLHVMRPYSEMLNSSSVKCVLRCIVIITSHAESNQFTSASQ